MKYELLKNKVHNVHKGAFTSVLWERDAKTKKSCQDIIKKRVRATVRVGVDYENLSHIKQSRIDGSKPATSNGLTWGEWKEFPYFIEHTPKNGIKTKYLRAYLGKNAQVTTEWFMNGRKVTKDDISQLVLASELKDEPITEEKPIVVKVDDILSFGG